MAASEDRFHYAPRKGIGKLRELNKHGPVKRFKKKKYQKCLILNRKRNGPKYEVYLL